ncbi:hypothetical protein GCM10011506_46500 [Marivirga lumbricoides]|uniref:Short NACHT-associated C-terminal domain-containing protein n=1 Tax=Marivirga lumbricoides TaxID=1046115 RepID=A0ABQ1NDJ3_9BACT|nr:hypothetical protein GCM10011506_46500 [Marivirga lumbricoides]
MIRRGDFIFFLDGYDEISADDKKSVTQDVQRFINNSGENTFILTSRPDDSLASFGNFQSFSINALREDQVYELLSKYDENGELSKSLITKLQDHYYDNLSEFLANPLLVSLLYTAYEYKHVIPVKKHVFYRQVYDALFEAHDLSKGDYYQRDKFSKLGIDDFHTILRYISFFCLKKDQIEFTKDEIIRIIEDAKEKCETINFKKSEFLKDLITTVPLFVKEGLYYKWAHKSLYEYFVAQFIYQDTGNKRAQLLKTLTKTKYINIIDIYSNIDYKSFRNEIIEAWIIDFIDFCNKELEISRVNSDSVIQRKELTYQQDYLIIQFDPVEVENGVALSQYHTLSQKCFEIVEKKFPSIKNDDDDIPIEGYGIVISNKVIKDISSVNFTISMDNIGFERSINDYILSVAHSKGEKFVRKTKWKKTLNFKKFNIPKETPFKVTDESESILNQPENYDFVNEILSAYYDDDLVFDYVESKLFIERQKMLNLNNAESDFLSIK